MSSTHRSCKTTTNVKLQRITTKLRRRSFNRCAHLPNFYPRPRMGALWCAFQTTSVRTIGSRTFQTAEKSCFFIRCALSRLAEHPPPMVRAPILGTLPKVHVRDKLLLDSQSEFALWCSYPFADHCTCQFVTFLQSLELLLSIRLQTSVAKLLQSRRCPMELYPDIQCVICTLQYVNYITKPDVAYPYICG